MATKKKNGRKKPRSAKQKAATRKLVAMNKRKAAPKRKAPKRKAPKRKAAPKRKPNKPAKKSSSVVSKKGLGKLVNNPTLKKVLLAAGAVSVATSVAAVVAPQFVPTLQRPIVRAALGFVTGDVIGAAANFVIGGGGIGGGGAAPAAANTGNIGFA